MTFTKNYADPVPQVHVRLPHGSLLLMREDSQDLLEHELKRDNSKGRRISITGRWIEPNNAGEGKRNEEPQIKELWEKVKKMNSSLTEVINAVNKLKEEKKRLVVELDKAKRTIKNLEENKRDER